MGGGIHSEVERDIPDSLTISSHIFCDFINLVGVKDSVGGHCTIPTQFITLFSIPVSSTAIERNAKGGEIAP